VIFADTSVLLDVLLNDPVFGVRSRIALDDATANDAVAINDIVYAELSVRYASVRQFDAVLAGLPLEHRKIPTEALFLAAKAFQSYRRRGGTQTGLLPDFFIGAHAAVEGAALLTRDPARVHAYFPTVELIAP
jgi:predicted nucleic acid-binding protein